MQLQLKLIGILLICLSFVHIAFPKYFKWKEDLQSLSLINKQMMYVHTFFIALTVFLMGVLCFSSSSELTQTPIGQRISLGFGIFWSVRLFFQIFVYSPKLWKGKVIETSVHILFIFLWSYLTIVFLILYFSFSLLIF